MDFKISKRQVYYKLLLVGLISLVLYYFLSTLFLVNNRINYTLINTTWVSRDSEILTFENLTNGYYKNGKDTKKYFTYESIKGYTILKHEETIIFELVGITDNRLFSVNTNTMFYDIKYLE